MKALNSYILTFVFFILSLVNALSVFAQTVEQPVDKNDKKSLIWLVEDKKENLNLLTMSAPTTSVATYIESRVIGQLKQYDIAVQRMSIKRIEQVLKTTPNACAANRAKLESRQKYSLFSTPQAFYLTHKLFRFNQSKPLDKRLFNDDGEITSLKAVFDFTPNEIIGLAKGVSFGPFLDVEVDKLAKESIYFLV